MTQTFTTPAGKRRRHTLHARVLRIGHVELLAADDGIAVRGATTWIARGTAWLQRYSSVYENPYRRTVLRRADRRRYGFPALLSTGRDWALLTESGIPYGARAGHLRAGPGRLSVRGSRRGWHVAVIGSLKTIVGSDLPLALGRPSQVKDPSWIHPGRAAWSWWSDSASTRSLARQQQFVDFAAAEHFEYATVDAGWDAAWVPDLAAYAAARNVRLILWTDWHALADPAQRAATLDQWAGWGIAGIKVDYLQSDAGARMAAMEDIARAAARRHLVVDFHGCTVPRGLQRTWPNVLALEAVRGAEYDRDGTPSDPANNVDLAFTRNAVGSMDYTPVTFSARNRITTDGHELAMSVVYESGLQHYADTPESYEHHPVAASVLQDVPAAWDDTRLVAGSSRPLRRDRAPLRTPLVRRRARRRAGANRHRPAALPWRRAPRRPHRRRRARRDTPDRHGQDHAAPPPREERRRGDRVGALTNRRTPVPGVREQPVSTQVPSVATVLACTTRGRRWRPSARSARRPTDGGLVRRQRRDAPWRHDELRSATTVRRRAARLPFARPPDRHATGTPPGSRVDVHHEPAMEDLLGPARRRTSIVECQGLARGPGTAAAARRGPPGTRSAAPARAPSCWPSAARKGDGHRRVPRRPARVRHGAGIEHEDESSYARYPEPKSGPAPAFLTPSSVR